MERTVEAHIDLTLQGTTDLVFSIAVAEGVPRTSESITATLDGDPVELRELEELHGTRLHHLIAPEGRLLIDYAAVVTGRAEPAPTRELDLVAYLRPSRYAQSDALLPTARSEFAGLRDKELLDAVSSWVGDRLAYVSGSSRPTDGALDTLLHRRGVCRDYAHLVVALLRALDVPARLVAVYAPGLSPMDFHAVAEAHVEDAWHVVDATTLAPRDTLVRISTGRDAADTSWLTSHGADVALNSLTVGAVVDELPDDDLTRLVRLR